MDPKRSHLKVCLPELMDVMNRLCGPLTEAAETRLVTDLAQGNNNHELHTKSDSGFVTSHQISPSIRGYNRDVLGSVHTELLAMALASAMQKNG